MRVERIRFDDGKVGQIEVPEDATADQINAFVKSNYDAIYAAAKPPFQPTEEYNYQDPNAGSLLNSVLRGATFDMADEAMGGIATLYAKMYDAVTGNDSGITYKDAVESVRGDQEAFAERNPLLNFAGEMTGALATGGLGAAKGMQALANASKGIKAAAVPVMAGAEGALYGFGSAEGGLEDEEWTMDAFNERLKSAGGQGAMAALTGYLMNKGGNAIGRRFFKKEAEAAQQKLVPTISEKGLSQQAKSLFKKADDMGIKIDASSYMPWKRKLMTTLANENITAELYPQLGRALRLLKRKRTPSYRDLDVAKQLVRKANVSSDPALRRAAGTLRTEIDNYINNLSNRDLISGSGDVSDLSDTLKRAKDLWSRKSQLEIVDLIEDKAYRSAQAVEMGNIDKGISDQIRPVLNNPRRKSNLEEIYQTKLDDIIKGGMGKNTIRAVAQIEPGTHTQRGLIPAAGSSLAAFGLATQGPAGLLWGLAPVLPGLTGAVAKRIGNKMTQKEISQLRHMIVNKGQPAAAEFAEALMEKYVPGIAGASAATAATADYDEIGQNAVTTLEDLMP